MGTASYLKSVRYNISGIHILFVLGINPRYYVRIFTWKSIAHGREQSDINTNIMTNEICL